MFKENPWDLAGDLARQWFRDQCADAGFSPFRVFYRPSDGATPGDVVVAKEAPGPEYKQASPQTVSPAWDVRRATAHLHEVIEPLPILPTVPPAAVPPKRARRSNPR